VAAAGSGHRNARHPHSPRLNLRLIAIAHHGNFRVIFDPGNYINASPAAVTALPGLRPFAEADRKASSAFRLVRLCAVRTLTAYQDREPARFRTTLARKSDAPATAAKERAPAVIPDPSRYINAVSTIFDPESTRRPRRLRPKTRASRHAVRVRKP